MPDTGERREITRRVNAKEVETIRQSRALVGKTKRFSAIADMKNVARRKQALHGGPRTLKEAVKHG